MSESDTHKWKLTYILTERIYCTGNLKGDDSIEFIIEPKNKPAAVTGFEITSKLTHQEDAKKEANLTAETVSDCMAILSKKNIKHRLGSMVKIVNEGTVEKIEVYGAIKTRIPTIVFNIDLKAFQRRNTQGSIKASVAHFTNALKAKESGDHNSMLRYLWLIYEDSNRDDLDKYRFLRNAVSHTKLHRGTINGLNKHYSRFNLINEKTFDFESIANKRLVTTEANELLDTAHKDLKKVFGIMDNI